MLTIEYKGIRNYYSLSKTKSSDSDNNTSTYISYLF